jgi:hypothetical protein
VTAVRKFLLACALGLLACTAGPAVALDDSAQGEVERAAYRALPSTYRVTVTVRVAQLRDRRRRLPVGHDVTISGTAFGIGPGTVVTARHVVRPRASELLAAVAVLGVRGAERFDPNDVRVTSQTTRIVLTRAAPRAQQTPDRLRATIAALSPSSSPADIALLRIPGRQNPALPLDDGTSRGTPVAVLGFGGQSGQTPAVRVGTIDLAARVRGSADDSLVTLRDMGAERGDSGGPVIDTKSRVHGVLIRRAVAAGDMAVMARASAIRGLASAEGIDLGPTPAQADFTTGMTAFWANDFATAAEALDRTAPRLPGSAWIADQARRANALAKARYEVVHTTPWRGPLILIALACVAVATVLAVRFWTLDDG